MFLETRLLLPCISILMIFAVNCSAQPLSFDPRLYDISSGTSPDRIADDISKLVSFGTRNTLSDTVSNDFGIGAARRWIKATFDSISVSCGGCLEVHYQRGLVPADGNSRIPEDTWVVNVIAVQQGTEFPNRHIVMSGDIDSRINDATNSVDPSPGANDNASGVAGVIEAARILTQYEFSNSLVYAALSGEEQGLFGGKIMAEKALKDSLEIIGILNNDMIGNIHGIDGVIDNQTFRIFSEPTPATDDLQKQTWRRFYGGEVDGPSRQLARYVHRLATQYVSHVKPKLIYRLDRFGRGGHHRPFNDVGFAGVRIMEAHEHYDRQHQDLRIENGISYGDVIEWVDFNYAAKLTAVNAVALASLGWAPPAPNEVRIGGIVQPSTYLEWDAIPSENLAGFKVYWRETTSPTWDHSRFVGKTNAYTLENIIIDNYLFGVAAISKEGHESTVVYPSNLVRRRR